MKSAGTDWFAVLHEGRLRSGGALLAYVFLQLQFALESCFAMLAFATCTLQQFFCRWLASLSVPVGCWSTCSALQLVKPALFISWSMHIAACFAVEFCRNSLICSSLGRQVLQWRNSFCIRRLQLSSAVLRARNVAELCAWMVFGSMMCSCSCSCSVGLPVERAQWAAALHKAPA